MKEYDLIVVGSGSAMNVVEPFMNRNPKAKVAVIDKDDPGGICLTRGCIPSKLLLYPAEVVSTIMRAHEFGIDVKFNGVDFKRVMGRMRSIIDNDIDMIRQGLSKSDNIDYFHDTAEFTAPYVMKVGRETINGRMIYLCVGSRTTIPGIKGIDGVDYLTSDSVLYLKELPKSIIIVGGGYIAAEYSQFFSSMGSSVTIIGRNQRLLPGLEPEISELVRRELSKRMEVLTGCEATSVISVAGGKRIEFKNRSSGETGIREAERIMLAVGRGPVTDILHPERAGIKTTRAGWIEVNEFFETSLPNVWAFGDADGKYLFKHVANYESIVVYYNSVAGERIRADYHAVPFAVFTYPEVAGVGMTEAQAIERYGKDGILIAFCRFEDTAKGEAMGLKDYFVKGIISKEDREILGAHIVGPEASVLIQEVINLMYTDDMDSGILTRAMHIHPSLSEVVERAFQSLHTVEQYHHMLEETYTPPLSVFSLKT